MRVPLGSCFCFEFVTNETHEREKEGEIFEFKPAQTSGCGNGKTATEKYPMLFAVATDATACVTALPTHSGTE